MSVSKTPGDTRSDPGPGWFRTLARWGTKPRPTSPAAAATDPRAELGMRGPRLVGTNGIPTDLDGSLNTSWDAKFRQSPVTGRNRRLS